MIRQFDNYLSDEANVGKVQAFQLNFLQMSQVGVQDVALQAQAGKFALAGDFDQACAFKFLHVVG